ncbi:MAG: hypothetical protein HYY46_26165 [Deltaproteobacteria bacterium]|nr:hypothetical protein [Deltaproteobacteria bacterium]
MRPLVSALLAFSFLSIAHMVVWRIRRLTGQYVGLLALCLAVLVASLASFYVLEAATPTLVSFVPVALSDYAKFVLLYTALALMYMTTYSAVQADNPP